MSSIIKVSSSFLTNRLSHKTNNRAEKNRCCFLLKRGRFYLLYKKKKILVPFEVYLCYFNLASHILAHNRISSKMRRAYNKHCAPVSAEQFHTQMNISAFPTKKKPTSNFTTN